MSSVIIVYHLVYQRELLFVNLTSNKMVGGKGEGNQYEIRYNLWHKTAQKSFQGLYLVLGDINQKDKYNFQSGNFSKAYL